MRGSEQTLPVARTHSSFAAVVRQEAMGVMSTSCCWCGRQEAWG